MRDMDFLPMEVKENTIKLQDSILRIGIIIIFFINVYIAINIIISLKFNNSLKPQQTKEIIKKSNNVKSTIEKDALDFYMDDIDNEFNCKEIKIKGDLLDIKIEITNNNSLEADIKKLESLKTISVKYLVAPYQENGNSIFEIGIQVLK